MASRPVTLDAPARRMVAESIRETSAFRGWDLIALSVRTNHVHVVISAPARPERVMTTVKARATRRLVESGWADPGERIWARHGSTRYLWSEASVSAAGLYVEEGQGYPLPDDTT
jgi:REP element-mobilizing transposase RayT